MTVADKTEVRWVDDWVRALGSFQKQSYAIDKSRSEKEFHYGSRQLGLRRFAGQQMTRFVSSA